MNIVISIFLTVTILAFIIFTLIRPVVFKPIIYSLTYIGDYAPFDKVTTIKEDYTLYSSSSSGNKIGISRDIDLIVVVIGGAFLFKNIKSYYGFTNTLYELATKSRKSKYDLLILRYPVRFENTLHEAMLAINRILTEIEAIRYRATHMIAFSAGALLTGTFIRKENNASLSRQINVPQLGIRIDSFVSVCGMLHNRFDNELLNWLFDRYIFSGTPKIKNYSCYGINAPTLVISSKSDLLYDQTTKFIQQEPCETKIYPEKISHSFVQMIHLPQSEDAIKNIMKFIEAKTDKK
jgi:acetyl esterase/lipase